MINIDNNTLQVIFPLSSSSSRRQKKVNINATCDYVDIWSFVISPPPPVGGLHRHCTTKCSSWSSVTSKDHVFLSLCQMRGRNSSFGAYFHHTDKVIKMHAPATRVRINIKSVEGLSVGKHQRLWFGEWRAARRHFGNSLCFLRADLVLQQLARHEGKQSTCTALMVMWKT